MKIRSDFVTNSSSSSFILGFTSEENIHNELFDGFPEWAAEYFYIVSRDVKSEKHLSKDEVIERARKEFQWNAEWEVQKEYERKHRASYREAWEYTDTAEGKAEVSAKIDHYINNIIKDMEGKSVFVEVEYDDGCDGELEYGVMPAVGVTIATFNHH